MNESISSLTADERVTESNKNLERAVHYTGESWIPVDPNVIEKIKQHMAAGSYQENRDRLFSDVREDVGLYLFCVRKLSELQRTKLDPMCESVSPTKVFYDTPLEEIARLLETPTNFISRHRIEYASELQLERLKESLISATAAETIADVEGSDPQLAYATALFRQLGLTLIAWNFPHVYSRVMSVASHPSFKTLDELFVRKIGFSPTMLGIRVARTWLLAPLVRSVMGDSSAQPLLSPEELAVAQRLSTICETGEALAQAQHFEGGSFEQSSGPATNWAHSRKSLEKILSPAQMKVLDERIQKNLAHYLRAAPNTYELPELRTPVKAESQESDNSLAAAHHVATDNKYLVHLPEEIRQKCEILYTRCDPTLINKENIQFLVQDIVLPLGFLRGSVYLVEPDQLLIVPRLAIGSCKLSDYPAFNYTSFSDREHPVVAAFRSNVPIAVERNEAEGFPRHAIAGALGYSFKAGVLYLELSDRLVEDPLANPTVYFKAIRELCNTCLNLG